MANRRDMMLWMKDLIDHMAYCHDQLQWAGDGPAQAFLAESLLGDLSQCRKLCEQLRQTQKNGSKVDSFRLAEETGVELSYRESMALS